jgi:transcriptional regulator with XRE-family HTH domain
MKELIDMVMQKLHEDVQANGFKEAAARTGLNVTRVFRLVSAKKEPWACEVAQIAEAYGLTLETLFNSYQGTSVELAKRLAEERAVREVWDRAETAVAQKFGMTAERMAWVLTDPVTVKALAKLAV